LAGCTPRHGALFSGPDETTDLRGISAKRWKRFILSRGKFDFWCWCDSYKGNINVRKENTDLISNYKWLFGVLFRPSMQMIVQRYCEDFSLWKMFLTLIRLPMVSLISVLPIPHSQFQFHSSEYTKHIPSRVKKSWLKCFHDYHNRSWNSVVLKSSQLHRQTSENCFIQNSVKRSGKSEMIGEAIDGVDELSGCDGNNWNVLDDGGSWWFGMDGTSGSLSVISKISISFTWNWREPVKIILPYSLVSLG
jgi:hypothetical protein